MVQVNREDKWSWKWKASQIPGGLSRMWGRERQRCEQHHTSMATCGKQPELRRDSRRRLCSFPPLGKNSWDLRMTQFESGKSKSRAQHQHQATALLLYHSMRERGAKPWSLAEPWSHWGTPPHHLWSALFPVWVCFCVAVIKHWPHTLWGGKGLF